MLSRILSFPRDAGFLKKALSNSIVQCMRWRSHCVNCYPYSRAAPAPIRTISSSSTGNCKQTIDAEEFISREDRSLCSQSADVVTFLTLNRHESGNTLSLAGLTELEKCLSLLDESYPKYRVIVIRSGGKLFCTGHDLTEIARHLESDNEGTSSIRTIFETCKRIMLSIQRIRPVVIAQVDGIATAAGCQLVAACDLAIASTRSKFALTGVKHGIVCSSPIVQVSRNMSNRKLAFRMLMTGEFITSKEALQYGLLDQVAADSSDLDHRTMRLAIQIGENSSHATASGKQLFYQQLELPLSDAANLGTSRIVDDLCNSHDARHGIHSFLNKRSPLWRGR